MSFIDLILCCSGKLGHAVLKKLLENSRIRVKAILTDSSSKEIIDQVSKLGIPYFIGNPRTNDFAGTIERVDILLSANYFYILPDSMIRLASKMAVNIHGSLLPKYMGRSPNTWVIINDEVETGITVHEIIAEVDAGDIIYQEKIPITNKDTGGTLTEKMIKRYPFIAITTILDIEKEKIKRRKQDLLKKSYCCIRNPSDGLVNWNWSSRKIYNWVRAQTKPYPGAFFFHNGQKYIMWWVEDCYDRMDRMNLKKGTPIEKDGNSYVKCGVGSVQLLDFEVIEV